MTKSNRMKLFDRMAILAIALEERALTSDEESRLRTEMNRLRRALGIH